MKKKISLIIGILTFSFNSFGVTNMLLPIIKCTLTKEQILKIKKDKYDIAESFVIMADFSDLINHKSGKAVLIYSDKQVGAVSKTDKKSSEIGSGLFGTFNSEVLGKDNYQDGTIFRSDLVEYNHKYKWNSEVIITIDKEKQTITAELRNVPEDGSEPTPSESYNCSIPGKK